MLFMSPAAQYLTSSARLDNALLRCDVVSGRAVPLPEILSLAGMAEAIFISATCEARSSDRVKDCRTLWAGIAELYAELAEAWVDVSCNENQSILWLRSRLEHFRSVALDRREMFTVTEKERLKHAKDRDADIERSNGSEPNGFRNDQSTPAQIYRCHLLSGTLAPPKHQAPSESFC
jgi:hypothetical protein